MCESLSISGHQSNEHCGGKMKRNKGKYPWAWWSQAIIDNAFRSLHLSVCPSTLSIYLPIAAYFPQSWGHIVLFLSPKHQHFSLMVCEDRTQSTGQVRQVCHWLSLFILANSLHICSHLPAICIHHVYVLCKYTITQRVYRSGLSKLSRLADIMTILRAKCSNFQVQLTSILLTL